MATQSNSDFAASFLAMASSGRVSEAFERFVAGNFTHHNAYFPGDRESLRMAMEQSAASEPNKSFTVKQVIESGDRVAVFSRLLRAAVNQEYAVVHIFRFEDGKIAELWDIGQEVPLNSPNALGMF